MKYIDNKTFADALAKSGLSQPQVAALMGRTQATVSHWKTGNSRIRESDFDYFLKVAGLVPGEILDKIDTKKTKPVTVADLIKFLKKLPKDFKILDWWCESHLGHDGFYYRDFKLPDIDKIEFISEL